MKLSDIPIGKKFTIKGFVSESKYLTKFMRIGFVKGTIIERTNINNPMIFKIRHQRIALCKVEEQKIVVKEQL